MSNRHEGHIRERSPGSWEIRYSLGMDALTGARKTATATVRGTKADAKRELRKRLHSKDEGLHVDPTRLTVKEYIERWLTGWAEQNVSPKTFERYGELLRNHVAAHVGQLPIQKLKPVTLSELYAKLLREGRDDDAGLSARTVGHVHRVLHRALGHALQWGVVQTNMATAVSPPPVASEEIEIVAPDRMHGIIEKLRGRDLYEILVMAMATGMRRGELLALRWQDVVLDGTNQPFVRVERSLEQTKAGLRFKSPKTKHGRRTITLPSFAIDVLRAHWKAQQETRLKIGVGKSPPEALVFSSIDGSPRRPDSLTKEWAKAANTHGIKVTFHGLRHTHASQLIAAGLDVLTISRRLGHGSPAVTLTVYGHLFNNSDARAADALDAAFSSTPK